MPWPIKPPPTTPMMSFLTSVSLLPFVTGQFICRLMLSELRDGQQCFHAGFDVPGDCRSRSRTLTLLQRRDRLPMKVDVLDTAQDLRMVAECRTRLKPKNFDQRIQLWRPAVAVDGELEFLIHVKVF